MKKNRIFSYFCLLIAFVLLVGCVHGPGIKTDPQQKYQLLLEERQEWFEYIKTYWYRYFEKKIETKHFIFYLFESKPWEIVETETQEHFYEYIAELFGVELKEKIIYIKCRDRKDIEKITGSKIADAVAHLDLNLIISLDRWENHELIHIVQNLFAECSRFFQEGLAVAFQIDLSRDIPYPHPHWERYYPPPHIHDYLQNKVIKPGEYVSINNILTSKDFETDKEKIIKIEKTSFYRCNITYLEAGSFVRYLINVYGLETFFQFLKISNYSDSKSEIEEKFLKVYGISIQEMEKQWLNFLEENF